MRHHAVPLDADVLVSEPAWREVLPDAERACARILGVAAGYLDLPRPVAVSVLLCDNARSRDLNHRFRGRDEPTNVLSFPAGDGIAPEDAVAGEAPTPLGDIAIALGVVRDEAGAAGRPIADHVAHLLVHGLLHLCGHDHQADAEAEAMESIERNILSALAIDDPYR